MKTDMAFLKVLLSLKAQNYMLIYTITHTTTGEITTNALQNPLINIWVPHCTAQGVFSKKMR